MHGQGLAVRRHAQVVRADVGITAAANISNVRDWCVVLLAGFHVCAHFYDSVRRWLDITLHHCVVPRQGVGGPHEGRALYVRVPGRNVGVRT